jgi:protoporphyrinogen/coproporphyrinogen III oxidase
LAADDAALVGTARAQLAELLGVRGEPLFSRVSRYWKAMPQYEVGHVTRVDAIEAATGRHPGLALAGGAYRGVGIADCVHSGEEAAQRLLG